MRRCYTFELCNGHPSMDGKERKMCQEQKTATAKNELSQNQTILLSQIKWQSVVNVPLFVGLLVHIAAAIKSE